MNPGPRRVSLELIRAYDVADSKHEGQLLFEGRRAPWLRAELARLAESGRSVLISGETGTGKSLIARHLHAQDADDQPLRVVNCAALSDALLMGSLSELPPPDTRLTLLLDEVGELSPWGQAVLLRFIQQARDHGSRLRLLSATHRNLELMASAGKFSRELLGFLRLDMVKLPPLRSQPEAVLPLALHFLRLSLCAADTPMISVEPELFEGFESYDWPGNVRELKNAVTRTLALSDGTVLRCEDLPEALFQGRAQLNRDAASRESAAGCVQPPPGASAPPFHSRSARRW